MVFTHAGSTQTAEFAFHYPFRYPTAWPRRNARMVVTPYFSRPAMVLLIPSIDPTQQLPAASEGPEAAPGLDSAPTTATPTSADHEEAAADPEPSTAPADPDGDSDPGASNTGDVHPL